MRFGAAFFIALLLMTSCARKPETGEERAQRLGRLIRCPVCRGVPIAESPAALAVQMMEIVRGQVDAGKGDEEVFQYFEARYGEWALLRPKAKGLNLFIWILPAFFLAGGIFVILRFVKGEKSAGGVG